jgi:1-acyl-sn-glycerol-3-phosphate acyltransferase
MMAKLRGLFLVTFWFVSIALFGPVIIFLTWLTKDENYMYKPIGAVIRIGLKLVGVKVDVRGLDHLDPKQAYIFTPNHQSFIEVPLFVTYLGRNPGYLAKKEVFKYPVFGTGIRLMKVIPVDRSNSPAAVESARLATTYIREGKSYMVYPEGTRSPDGKMLPFKKGAFIMAIEAGVPIVPVTVSGAARVMPKNEFNVFPSTVHLTVHEPISTVGYSKENVIELMQRTREKIYSALSAEEAGITAQ